MLHSKHNIYIIKIIKKEFWVQVDYNLTFYREGYESRFDKESCGAETVFPPDPMPIGRLHYLHHNRILNYERTSSKLI